MYWLKPQFLRSRVRSIFDDKYASTKQYSIFRRNRALINVSRTKGSARTRFTAVAAAEGQEADATGQGVEHGSKRENKTWLPVTKNVAADQEQVDD